MPGCIFIAGPTATGKSELATPIAEKLGGEIISVDSMQVYRGLDLGTDKPSHEDRARVRHHLIDVLGLHEAFDGARFVRMAREAKADIQSRGRVAVFCGGTGLYFKAFIEGLGGGPTDPQLRAELEATPLEQLLEELAQKDPVLHQRIDRHNARRVLRALEVIRLTGRPYSEQRAQWSRAASPGERVENGLAEAKLFGLEREQEDLHRRINRRVERMFEAGLVAETAFLLTKGLALNRTAMQAIGYRQAAEHLRGERNLPETVELVKQRTRNFARRQLTWFRRQLRVEWTKVAPEESLDPIAERICRMMDR